MIKIKDYSWALLGLGALLLLVGFVMMCIYTGEAEKVAVSITGLGVLFFTLIRIKPILASRNEKDFIIIMLLELIIDLVVGITFLFFAENVVGNSGKLLSFSHLAGLALFIRGTTHFYTTSKRYELHDIYSFLINILFIGFGFSFLWAFNLTEGKIVVVLIVLSLLLSVVFGYQSYNGYNNFRIKKQNILKMGDYLNKKAETVVEDPKKIEDTINPKTVEEPKEEKPSVNVN